MAYFDEHPQLFRFLFGALLIYLFGMAARNFYHSASSPTDENWFVSSPAKLYVIKSFSGQLANYTAGLKKGRQQSTPQDSVLVGDLLLTINRQKPDSLAGVHQILRAFQKDSTLVLHVFRPKRNEILTYRVTKAAVPDSFLRPVPATAYVYEVFKDGASDRAGIKVGDLIFRINGRTFRNSHEADQILRSGQTGKTIVYDVIRDNQVLALPVKLARFGVSIPLLVMCLSGLVYFGVGTFIALQRPQIKAARLLGSAFLLVGFFMMVVMTLRTGATSDFTITRGFAVMAGLLLGIAVWFHSDYYFPKERTECLGKRWLSAVPYLFALICLGLALIAGRDKVEGMIFPLAIFLMLVLTLTYKATLYFFYRKQRSAERKRMSQIIKWTGLTVGGAVFVLMFVLGGARNGYIGIPLVFIPLAYLYTIGRYRLLEMDLRVRRNVQFTIVSLIWVLLVLALAFKIFLALPQLDLPLPNVRLSGGSIEVLDSPMPSEQRVPLEKGVLILIAVGLSFAFWQIIRVGQRLIAQKFYRGQFDYRRAASELTEVMATKLSMADLSRGIVQKLADLMQLQRVGVLFFREQKACCCQEAYGFDGKVWKEFCMSFDRKLAEVIQQFRSESRFSVDYLPHDIKESFQRHGFRHIIPIRFKEKLVGTLLVGEKRSETPFYSDDLAFLAAVAKQASVAIENAFLHEQLSEQERLKHELAIARRIQLASLPQSTPKVDGLDIAGISIPAMEVGGDYFDYLNGVPTAITVIVGDVSGKGTSAALYMSKVQGILRSLHGFGLSPKELFIRANQLLCQDMERKSFVTSLGADFDSATRRLVLARAGHLPLFYYHAQTQRVEKITPKGLGLGLDHHGAFANELEEKTIEYQSGDIFLFVTDGVTEAQGRNGGEFGEESLLKILENNSALSANLIRDRVITAVKQFAGEVNQHDDQTVVVVKAL
jgi:serine phosphatase RsbU (regulator of sigma subunit)